MANTSASRAARTFGYLVAIAANGVIWFIVNNLLNWNVPFVTDSLTACLWAINLSIAVTIISQIILIVYDPDWLRHLLQGVTNIFAMVSLIVFYQIFPLALPTQVLDQIVRWGLVIILIIMPLVTLIELVRMVRALLRLSRPAAAE